MNPLQIAQLALSVFSMVQPILQPYEVMGINALIADIKTQTASGKKMSFGEVHALAATHNVNMPAVYARVGMLGLVGGYLALSALRRK